MRTRRRLRRLLTALAALVAVVASGAAAPRVGAERRSTIIFQGQESGVISLSSGGGGGGQEIQLNVLPDTAPLPKKFVIEVPSGYTLDLNATAGTEIGDARIAVVGIDSQSFATGYGSMIAKDSTQYTSDVVAQACAPGAHAAVWAVSTAIAGQQLSMTIFVDRGGEPGVAYTLQSCPTGLTAGNTRSAAFISIGDLDELAAPTSTGSYLWHAFVTPQSAQTYELQALVPLPESVTLNARYEPKRRTAVLRGKVVEDGTSVPNVRVFVTGSRGDNRDFNTFQTQTKGDGSFSVRAHITGTTDFEVTVAPSSGFCMGTSTAPGGCVGLITIPPDDAFTTVWVSVRGGALRAIRAADQRRADRENLAASDFPAGFQTGSGGGDACANPTHESDLTITGESTSPSFYDLHEGEALSLVQVLGIARVYSTAKQARLAFKREALPSTLRCELKELGRRLPKITPLRLSGLSARVRAFRVVIAAGQDTRADVDLVFLQRGRSVARLLFVIVGSSEEIEHVVSAKVALRMR
jgi:hypothetical protein